MGSTSQKHGRLWWAEGRPMAVLINATPSSTIWDNRLSVLGAEICSNSARFCSAGT